MENKIKIPWLRILLWGGLGFHLILISLSFLEVAIYSLVINPGKEELFYTEHAQQSAPLISIIFGVILFYFVSKYLSKNKAEQAINIALLLSLTYIFVDTAILLLSDANWQEMKIVLMVSFITKAISAYAGALSSKNRK